MVYYTLTIFLSAFLLFALQPLMGKVWRRNLDSLYAVFPVFSSARLQLRAPVEQPSEPAQTITVSYCRARTVRFPAADSAGCRLEAIDCGKPYPGYPFIALC